ncbi:MAG TPA: methyltransferase domain-containing protein [Pirellulaceae bacterium]
MTLNRILESEVMDSPAEAADYDAMDHAEVNRRFVEDLLTTISNSEFSIQNSELDILDLGTGTALIPIELCQKLAGCRIMAADAAVSMLELARYNVEVNGLTERIELAHVDAKKLPFNDAMFDVVMSNSIIHHIPEPIDVLRGAVRVAKAGGLLFFRDLLRPETDEQLKDLVAVYTAGANVNQRRLFAESLHAALSLDEIRSLVTSLGFPADTVQQTSDRHWTWPACRSSL